MTLPRFSVFLSSVAVVILFVGAMSLFMNVSVAAEESTSHSAVADTHSHAANVGHDDGHGSSHATPDPSPFTFDKFKQDLALWSLIIFLIVFGILGKFAFGPIAIALDAREKSVADQIAEADRAHKDAKVLLEQYQLKLQAAEDEVRRVIEVGKKEAEVIGQSIVEKSRQAAEQERTRALKEIEAATTLALQELAEKGATLATILAGKLIRDRVDPAKHRALIDTAIKQFAAGGTKK